MRSTLLILAALLLAPPATLNAASNDGGYLPDKVVTNPGAEAEDNARAWQGIPGIERAGKGHVTIGSSKIGSVEPGFVTIRDYEGRVRISGGAVQYPTLGAAYQTNPVFLTHTGKRPLDFILAAPRFFQRGSGEPDPISHFAESVRFAGVGNSRGSGQSIHPLPNRVPEGSLRPAAEALDGFREIGRINLRLNYPNNRYAAI